MSSCHTGLNPRTSSPSLTPTATRLPIGSTLWKLVLSAGSYYCTAFDFEPQAQIVAPSTNEDVKVFVRDSVIYRGSTVTSGGSAAPLFLGYTGTLAFSVESAYLGTLVAPNTQVTLQTLNGQSLQGEFLAKGIVVAAHAQVVSKPLSCGKSVAPSFSRFTSARIERPSGAPSFSSRHDARTVSSSAGVANGERNNPESRRQKSRSTRITQRS